VIEPRSDVDIARDLRSIEWLKTELLGSVAQLFKGMREAGDVEIAEQLATVILTSYILGRRLGIDYGRLDLKLRHTVRANAKSAHDFEEWYGDFSALSKHFESRER